MRKIAFIVLLSIISSVIIFPVQQARAAFQTPAGEAYLAAYYNSWRNEYRAVYSKGLVGQSWDTLRVYFETTAGAPYSLEYPASVMINASAYWLTCNGSYQFQYLNGGAIVGHSEIVITTEIASPTCLSYPDGGGANDANASSSKNPGDPNYTLNWSDIPGSTSYEIWKDGVLIETVPADPSGEYSITIPAPGGGISIVGKDGNGDYTGHSDINVPEDIYENPDAGTGCDMCEKIAAALECPEWDTYMGELTGAIKNALPTLPEWRTIADQFVDAFDEYLGDPPAVPNPTNITPDIPAIDTSVPDADFDLVVPDDFNTPLDFDITSAPAIPVVDESEPFEIDEPDANIESDEPGVFVYPGDERNHSDGIKQPDTIVTGYPEPVPTIVNPAPGDLPEIPPSDIPIPSGTTGDIAIPGASGGIIPIPTLIP